MHQGDSPAESNISWYAEGMLSDFAPMTRITAERLKI
jgi:hypothetical protein